MRETHARRVARDTWRYNHLTNENVTPFLQDTEILCFSALNLPCYLDQMVVASLFQGFSCKKERKSYRRGSSGSYNKRRLPAVSRHLEISHRLMFTLRAGFRVLVSPCGTAAYYTIGCRLGKKLESAKWKGVGGLGRSPDTTLLRFLRHLLSRFFLLTERLEQLRLWILFQTKPGEPNAYVKPIFNQGVAIINGVYLPVISFFFLDKFFFLTVRRDHGIGNQDSTFFLLLNK